MKELARFIGKVTQLGEYPQPSLVTLKEVSTGKLCDTEAVTQKLIEAGLKQDDDFEIIINQSIDGTISGFIRRLFPVQLTQHQIDSINKEVNDKLGVDLGDGI